MVKKPTVYVRETVRKDGPLIEKWLMQEEVLKGFPMSDEREVHDAVRIWMQYVDQGTSLTALYKKKPCAAGNLYIQPIEKLKHQCLFVIIVDQKHRGQGVGTLLMGALERRAKEMFNIELFHLEVYEGNPAVSLYERLGFVYYGEHPRFLKGEDGKYSSKILMQKMLV